ncbi:MAG TPA: hemolysin family protein [Chiayiivirga sp.]|nr:hemolysin family protein [Chiayiivirga sp.]
MTLELLVVALLVLLNGFFALSEMSVIVSRKARLRQMASKSRRAREALKLAEQPERFLATVQVGTTLTGILTGMLGGAVLSPFFTRALIVAGVPVRWADNAGLALSVVLVTYATVIVGELLPKRAALLAPERIASAVAMPMQLLARAATPFVWVLARSLRLLLRLLGLNHNTASQVTEEEIRVLLAESHEQGLIDDDERKMMNRVMRLGDRSAENLMTPRTRIAWLDIEAPLAENLAVMQTTPYSRYPVYRGSDDDVVGILETKSLAITLTAGGHADSLFANLGEAVFVPESTPALALPELFREHNNHLALVVDEYGDLQGLVTRNDVFSAVLGQLAQDQAEEGAQAPIVQREDGSLLVDGSLSCDDLRELLNLSHLPGEDSHEYTTAAGMVVAHFGRIPATGESFVFGAWRIEVVDLDGARIDKLLVQRHVIAPLLDESV